MLASKNNIPAHFLYFSNVTTHCTTSCLAAPKDRQSQSCKEVPARLQGCGIEDHLQIELFHEYRSHIGDLHDIDIDKPLGLVQERALPEKARI